MMKGTWEPGRDADRASFTGEAGIERIRIWPERTPAGVWQHKARVWFSDEDDKANVVITFDRIDFREIQKVALLRLESGP